MAEQILGFGRLDERHLATMNVMTARKDVATTLISNSGWYTYIYTYIGSTIRACSQMIRNHFSLYSGYVESLHTMWKGRQ